MTYFTQEKVMMTVMLFVVILKTLCAVAAPA